MAKEIHFKVPNIICGNCAGIIENLLTRPAIKKLLPIEQVFASECTNVYIVLDDTDGLPSDSVIKEIIQHELGDLGYVADFRAEETVSAEYSIEKNKANHLIRNYLIKGIVGTVCGIGLLILCACGVSLPMIGMYLLAGLSSCLSLYLGMETYKAALGKIVKTKTLTMETLFTVSTLTAIGVSIASLFVSWLPMMFDAALLIFGFRYLGMAIETKMKRTVIKNVLFQDKIPHEIEIEKEGKREKIAVRNLQPGDVMIIRKGDMIPVDSFCKNDMYVDGSIYTGNSRQLVNQCKRLVGGMVVLDEEVKVIVQKTVMDPNSFLVQADKKLIDTRKHTAQIEEIATEILKYFVPVIFGLAIISGICIGLLFTPALALQCVISMLVSACPCTLGFIVPLSIKIGISKGRENDIHFTGGKYLQQAEKINAMVFDLNGTLTNGTPKVMCIKSTDKNISEESVKKYLSILEKKSDHVIGRTIYYYTKESETQNGDADDEIVDIVSQSNSGICKIINGEKYTVGNDTMLKNAGIPIGTELSLLPLQKGEQIIYLAKNAEVIGYVVIYDSLRDDAKIVVKELQQSGVEVFICTGADKKTADSFAQTLNITLENVYAGCQPFVSEPSPHGEKQHSKFDFIQSLQDKGYKVGMVGDANNDALAIAKSEVGFAIRSHAEGDIAHKNAGAHIKGTSLLPVLSGLAIAKQTIRNIKQNLVISLTYNMAVLLIAGGLLVTISFVLNPAIGVALMVLQTCLVLLSVYYLKRKQLPTLTENTLAVSEEKDWGSHAIISKGLQPGMLKPSEKPLPKKDNGSFTLSKPFAKLSMAVTRLFARPPASQKVNQPVVETRFIPSM